MGQEEKASIEHEVKQPPESAGSPAPGQVAQEPMHGTPVKGGSRMAKPQARCPYPSFAIAAILAGLYIGAQCISDIASLKVGVILGLAVDMGTFIYPITFTLRDLVHKALGKRAAQAMVVTAAVVNLFMAAYMWWAAKVPAARGFEFAEDFSNVFAPVWRIVVASIAAELISELVDTEIYHQFVKHTSRYQWARVLLSNSVSVPVDNLVFALGAFAFVLPWTAVAQIFFANLIVKLVVTFVGLPLIYLIPNRYEADRAGIAAEQAEEPARK